MHEVSELTSEQTLAYMKEGNLAKAKTLRFHSKNCIFSDSNFLDRFIDGWIHIWRT